MNKKEKAFFKAHLRPALVRCLIGIPQGVVDPELWTELRDSSIELARVLGTLVLRIISLCLYPLTVLILTPLTAYSELLSQRQRDEMDREWYPGNFKGVLDDD